MSYNKKLYFCGMSGPGSLEDIEELLEPIKDFFDGIVWVLHDSFASKEEEYLYSLGQESKLTVDVIHLRFCNRHEFSRNHYLFCGPIKNGDWIVQTDSMEHLAPSFAVKLPKLIQDATEQNLNAVYYYGKPLFYEYHESLTFQGSPHEGLRRLDGQMRAIELANAFPNEEEVRKNMRPFKRKDPNHWIMHYARYFVAYPWGSNTCLLGLEKNGDPNQLFPIVEARRIRFREEMSKLGYELTVEGLKKLMDDGLNSKMKEFFNTCKELNDAYAFYKLGRNDLVDNHNFNEMVKID